MAQIKDLSLNDIVDSSLVGLGNVDNTSDANKPVSTAQATAIGAKADTSSVAQWTKITKTFADFAAASLTNDISIFSLPAKGYIHDVKIVPTTEFLGGVISAATISVGIVSNLVKYAVAANVFTGNTTLGLVHTPIAGVENTGGVTDIRAAIVAVGVLQTLNDLTQGSVDIYLLTSILP